MPLNVKRVYEKPSGSDGVRVLVDRVWPRGLTKQKARVDEWMRDIAPSDSLRKWFGHDPEKWPEFEKRYFKELARNKDMVQRLVERSKKEKVTILFGAKDEEHNQAVAIKDYVESGRAR